MRAIAQIINHQTEVERQWSASWVSREEISLESRILGLVEDFQQRVTKLQASDSSLPETSVLTQALAECKQQGGDLWDPKR